MEFSRLIITNSEAETIEQGFEFAKELKAGDVVLLSGELGAGKTEFIKGICNFFAVGELVTSPTFTIINQYFGTVEHEEIAIYHVDLYRLKFEKEIHQIGLTEYLDDKQSIKLIEWAEKAKSVFHGNEYNVEISFIEENQNQRSIYISRID